MIALFLTVYSLNDFCTRCTFILLPRDHHNTSKTSLVPNLYWVTRQDVAQETEKWAEWAALARAADSAHFYISCATSCLVTQYRWSFLCCWFLAPPVLFFTSLSLSLSLSIGFRQKPFLKDKVCIIGGDDNPFKVEDRGNNLFARSTMDRKDAFNPFAALREESILAWRNKKQCRNVIRTEESV